FSGANYDIKLSNGKVDDDLIEQIQAMDNITNDSTLSYTYIDTKLGKEQVDESFWYADEEEVLSFMIELNVIDEATLRSYAEEVGVAYEDLTNTEQLSAVVINTATAPREKRGEIKSFHLEKGDRLRDLSYMDWDLDEEVAMDEVLEVAEATDIRPLGVSLPS